MLSPNTLNLRQCVLAVSVLSDLDVVPQDGGVQMPGRYPVLVPWAAIAQAAGGFPTCGPIARRRVESLLRLHRVVAELGEDAGPALQASARVVALPAEHTEHPGEGWARESLRGNALELGIGVSGLLGELDRTTALPPSVLVAAGVDAATWWPGLREHAERMGALSASRLAREGVGVIRPVGGCDVLALLSSRTLRRHLATGDGSGMRALAAPTRRRGWYDVSRIDPAFIETAWWLTEDHLRGMRVPLLITADEVALPFTLA